MVTRAEALEEARARLVEHLAAVDTACSRFRQDSALAAAEKAGEWVAISPVLTDLLDAGLSAARLTEGDVDPTVGRAMAAIGYDRDFRALTGGRIVVACPAPGWRSIELDRAAIQASHPAAAGAARREVWLIRNPRSTPARCSSH